MKHYYLGCVDNYNWNKNNFDLLTNVIKRVTFATILAYEIKGFIHGDLHSSNIFILFFIIFVFIFIYNILYKFTIIYYKSIVEMLLNLELLLCEIPHDYNYETCKKNNNFNKKDLIKKTHMKSYF